MNIVLGGGTASGHVVFFLCLQNEREDGVKGGSWQYYTNGDIGE